MTREKTTMEKRLLLFLVLSFGLMFIYTQLLAPEQPAPDDPGETGTGQPATGTAAPAPEKPAVEPARPAPEKPAVPAAELEGADAVLPPVASGAGDRTSILRARARWDFDTWGGSIRTVALRDYAWQADQDLAQQKNWYCAIWDMDSAGDAPVSSRSATVRVLDADGKRTLALDRVLWKLTDQTEKSLVFTLPVAEAGLEFQKVFTFPDTANAQYHVNVKLTVKVTDRARAALYAVDGQLRLSLRGAGGMPVEPFSQGVTVIGAVQDNRSADPEELNPPGNPTDAPHVYPEQEDQGDGRYVEWAGMHTRFFATVLKSLDPKVLSARRAVMEPVPDRLVGDKEFTNLAPAIEFQVPLPQDGGSVSRDFLFYVGPMDPDILSAPPYESFKSIIDYGFFGPIVKLLVFLLAAIKSVVGSWGIAIIILTLIVRASLFPLSRKSQVSMQKYQGQMARMKPKIDEIKKRHANNKKKQQEEQMKLMKEEGMQMFPAGCLVMFLQLPVFIGLFQALRYTIGLRHAPFLWAANLTAPDQLAGPWTGHGIPLLWDPLYLNVLPILMGITWYLSSAMAPKPADPQQAQQMKMMKFMPIIFSLLLYNYPAGLALYMVVSSTWSIFEMKVVRKVFMKAEDDPANAPLAFRKGK